MGGGGGEAIVLPASYTDRECGFYARERVHDTAILGHGADVQARVARDVYAGCMAARTP